MAFLQAEFPILSIIKGKQCFVYTFSLLNISGNMETGLTFDSNNMSYNSFNKRLFTNIG